MNRCVDRLSPRSFALYRQEWPPSGVRFIRGGGVTVICCPMGRTPAGMFTGRVLRESASRSRMRDWSMTLGIEAPRSQCLRLRLRLRLRK